MSVTVLMVAEKPMLADSIARLLSDGRAYKRKGSNKICSVSEYEGDFMGQRALFKVTSTCGHVMSVDFPEEYKNWHRVQPIELYTAPIDKIEATPEMKMNRYLASEAKGADYLVLWLDCDKEGENICYEVIDAVQSKMRKPRRPADFMSVVYRAHFSAITEQDIKAAMLNLGRPNINESLAVDARRELDLRVGCSFTRLQTKYFKGKYAELDASVISYGPCQTPTLGFCVTRHDEIVRFQPEPYYVLQASFIAPDGQSVRAEWSRGRLSNRMEALSYLERIRAVGGASVVDVNKRRSERDKPVALNTVKLMRAASTQLGLSPATTMHIAETLYTQGYISYPRTETTSYPASFNLHGTLSRQTADHRWGEIAAAVLRDGIVRPRGGLDKGDHPPITPMRAAGGALSGDNARVYEYVVRHFIATLMRNCVYEVTTVKLLCGQEEFSFQGKQLLDPGFTVVLSSGVEKDTWTPRLERGDQLRLGTSDVVDRETTAPSYLTESELISLMEQHGIGTDASIPVHINMICQRNYVTVESGRRLVPTQLGVCLIHGYRAVDPELVLPTIRADLERQLNLIATGEADYTAVKNYSCDLFRRKFEYFVQNMPVFDALFAATFTVASQEDRMSAVCGKCRVNSKTPGRLYCVQCTEHNKSGGAIRSAGHARGLRGARGRGRGASVRGASRGASTSTRGTTRGRGRAAASTSSRGSTRGRGASSSRGGDPNLEPLGTRGGRGGSAASTRGRGRGSSSVSHAPPLPMPPPLPSQQWQQQSSQRDYAAPPPLPMPPAYVPRQAPPPAQAPPTHTRQAPPPPLPMPPSLPQPSQQPQRQSRWQPLDRTQAPPPSNGQYAHGQPAQHQQHQQHPRVAPPPALPYPPHGQYADNHARVMPPPPQRAPPIQSRQAPPPAQAPRTTGHYQFIPAPANLKREGAGPSSSSAVSPSKRPRLQQGTGGSSNGIDFAADVKPSVAPKAWNPDDEFN